MASLPAASAPAGSDERGAILVQREESLQIAGVGALGEETV
jgi:hypothetical protein